MPTLARSTFLSSEVITGRGVAEPPKLNIQTFHGDDEEYYHHRPNTNYDSLSSDSYTSYQTNDKRDIYNTLREKLHSNEQIQKYIVSLKEQLRRNQNRVRMQMRDYSRATSADITGGIPRGRSDNTFLTTITISLISAPA